MDGLKVLHPPPSPDTDAAAARRLHRELNARPARRRRRRVEAEAERDAAPAPGGAVKEEEEEEVEEVKVRAVEWWPVVKAEQVEEVEIRAVEWAGEGGERKRVKREGGGVAEAGPSGQDGLRGQTRNSGRGTSRFWGVTKANGGKGAKPWAAQIYVTKDGKHRQIHIATFSRDEDAARAYDRVSIAKLGHAKAKTNFPVAQYREEWAELEALGVEGAVALMREHAAAERVEVMNKVSRFRGVTKEKKSNIKPWRAKIWFTEDSKHRKIHIGYFAREEDAACVWDRVIIAKLGHAKAKTNFPVAEYRAEWAELGALGAGAAVARERQQARQD